MTETPMYFANGPYSLFGVFHEAAGSASGTPFVFCHAFGEEKLWTHRVFVSFARQLAAAGHPVLRFDYMGNGDSDGRFQDSSLASIRSDVLCAIAKTQRMTKAKSVNLLGLRWGATVASLVAEEAQGLDRLILWAPIVDGARYMQELLRINLTTQMSTFKEIRQDREALVAAMAQGETANVDGYEMSFALYSEASAVKLCEGKKGYAGPCLIVHVDKLPGRPNAELQQLAAAYGRATLTFAQEEAFWKEIATFYERAPNLVAATDEWLRSA